MSTRHRRGSAILALLFALGGTGDVRETAAQETAPRTELLRGGAVPEPATRSAVGAALQDAGVRAVLRVIERFDPATGVRTYEALPHPSPREVLAAQRGLAAAGYGAGEAGRLDRPTRSALERFQRERGLAVCGCLDYETAVALGLSPVVVLTVVASERPPGEGAAGVKEAGREDESAAAEVEVLYPAPPSAPAEETRQATVPGAPGPAAGGSGPATDGEAAADGLAGVEFLHGPLLHGHLLHGPLLHGHGLLPGPGVLLFPDRGRRGNGAGGGRGGPPFGTPSSGASPRRGIPIPRTRGASPSAPRAAPRKAVQRRPG